MGNWHLCNTAGHMEKRGDAEHKRNKRRKDNHINIAVTLTMAVLHMLSTIHASTVLQTVMTCLNSATLPLTSQR